MKTLESIKTGNLSPERREFLKKSGTLALMSAFGLSFFTSCSDDDQPGGGDPPAPSTGITVNGNEITIDLDLATVLRNTGGWALITEARVLVVNVGGNDFSALTSVCTHSNCDRNWTFANEVFTCTCHGSRFRTDGTVVNGPAIRPLRTFPVEVDGNIVKVSI